MNELPYELLDAILDLAVQSNDQYVVTYTYGLTTVLDAADCAEKYIRGPTPSQVRYWDASNTVRRVCSRWHMWVSERSFKEVLECRPRGSHRWADLPSRRGSYPAYELVQRPRGIAIQRDPNVRLERLHELLSHARSPACHIRRLWFNGFYHKDTDHVIAGIAARCNQLDSLTAPWTMLRRCSVEEWCAVLKNDSRWSRPLRSLHFESMSLSRDHAVQFRQESVIRPMRDSRVSLSALQCLKFCGDARDRPIVDEDLLDFACTIRTLRHLEFSRSSTCTWDGILALLERSKSTLTCLEHTPRSYQGSSQALFVEPLTHLCCVLGKLSALREVSVFLPTVCAQLFSEYSAVWQGDVEIDAGGLCGCSGKNAASDGEALRELLAAARRLMRERHRLRCNVSVRIKYAGCTFEPGRKLVQGRFSLTQTGSPLRRSLEVVRRYKDETSWLTIAEEDYLLLKRHQ